MDTILKGWAEDRSKISPQLTPYYSMRDELSIYDGLVFKGERLVVLRAEIKKDIHALHTGVEGCLKRVRESVYWPGMNSELKRWISTCEPCRLFEVSRWKETFMSHDIPEALGESCCGALHPKPEILLGNGRLLLIVVIGSWTGYITQILELWSENSRPTLQGMGVRVNLTAKGGNDFYLGLLAERNIPSQGIGSSPVQRLMNRRTRTLLPTTGSLLEPRTLSSSHEREKLKDVQKKKARYYNSDVHDLPELNEGDNLRLKPFVLGQKEWKKGVVVERLDERSYEIETADGSSYRCNRAHLKKTN
ncbi:uncharacterized protein [Pocillopora verrucosa]|uniref:uncharacterized protein n=1 Tax=Pocillopora verrucosa TaxID=203993 RepID=UPI00334192AB